MGVNNSTNRTCYTCRDMDILRDASGVELWIIQMFW